MQESSYRLNAKGCHYGIRVEDKSKVVQRLRTCAHATLSDTFKQTPENCAKDALKKEVKVCSDFGIGQIYYKTAQGFGLDVDKLLTDLDYSVEAGAIVLADFKKRYSRKESDWWTRYNASSRSKRNIYKTLVERYL